MNYLSLKLKISQTYYRTFNKSSEEGMNNPNGPIGEFLTKLNLLMKKENLNLGI